MIGVARARPVPRNDKGFEPNVTVLVIAYRKPDCLDRLLGRLESPVWVVNVGCDPAVAAVARRHGASLLDLSENRGFGPAVNAGIAMVESPFVIVTNDDVVISEPAIRDLAAAVDRGADVVGPRLLTDDGQPEASIIGLPDPLQVIMTTLLPDRSLPLLRRLPVAKWSEPAVAGPVPALTAAVIGVRTSLLKSCPMPEAYFMYWEEAEWFWRLRRLGARVEFCPDIAVVHDGGRQDVRPEKASLISRNAVRCVRRTRGRTAAMVVWPAVVAGALRLLVVDLVRELCGGTGEGRTTARWVGLRAALAAVTELR